MNHLDALRQLQMSLGAQFAGDAPPASYGSSEKEYAALHASVAVVDVADRTQIELRGPDRIKFLHGLCTNEIRRLEAGQGCELFLLDARGHILAHGAVFAGEESLVFETVPGQAQKLLTHLDRYLIREQVLLANRAPQWAELLLAGPQAAECLARTVGGVQDQLPRTRLAHAQFSRPQGAVEVRCVDWIEPPAFLLSVPALELVSVWQRLLSAGAVACGSEAFEQARIEAGYPWYDVDITEQNLPQEVNRDNLTISFTKGCYLGQETVARIDALGHVNKKLVRVHFTRAEACGPGEALHAAGKPAGSVTSSARSPRLGGVVGLAYVRREFWASGTVLDSACGPVHIL